jgi:hypothetical protein
MADKSFYEDKADLVSLTFITHKKVVDGSET